MYNGITSAERTKLNELVYFKTIGGVAATSTNDTLTFTSGSGIKITNNGKAITFAHSNAVTAGTASGTATKTLAFGNTFDIPTITYDAQGHITAKGTTTLTLPANPDTHWTANIITANSATATANAAQTSNGVYLNLVENSTVRNSHLINGESNITVKSDANGKITISAAEYPTLSSLSAVSTARKVSAGGGLTGGGDLTADRTISHGAAPTTGTAKSAGDKKVVTAVNIDTYGHVATVTGSDLDAQYIKKMTGYTEATAVADVSVGDSLNTAIGKLQKNINTIKQSISSAMHFKGAVTTKADLDKVTGMSAGDVYIVTDTHKEYVYVDATTKWIELGDESMLSSLDTAVKSIVSFPGWTAMPYASTTAVGGMKLYSDTKQTVAPTTVTATASRTYAVQLNSSNQAVVNVPWTNTTYAADNTAITLSSNKFSHNTAAGYKHIPTGGTTGQILEYKASGEAQWSDALMWINLD